MERENSVSLIKRRCTVGNLTNKLDQVDSILKTKCKRISNFPTKKQRMSRVGTGFSRPSRQFKNTSFKGYGIEEEFHSNVIKNISTNHSPKLEK